MGLEGIVSKRRDRPYRSGRRDEWLKIKCTQRQEFVVAGYLPLSTGGRAVGALVLGVYERGDFVYVGRVGSGFSVAVARELWQRLHALRIKAPPFAAGLPPGESKKVLWVEPKLVAEVEYRGWTSDGLLRHASFKGLRQDKDPRQVVREDAS
jgi:bifunctional non-homologous end joining protein LigD